MCSFLILTAGGNASDDEDPAGAAAAAAPLHCKVNEQKETVDGLVDAECGEAVQDGNAGLCRLTKMIVPHLIGYSHVNWSLFL